MNASSANAAEPPIVARLVITLGAPFVVWLVRSAPLDLLEEQVGMTVADFTVGLTPFVTGFLLVELFATLLPRARALRSSGPEGRSRLTRWAVIVSAAAMGVQLLGILLFWKRFEAFTFARGLALILLNVAFTLGMVWLAQAVSRQGLANGYAVLLAAETLPVDLVLDHPFGKLVGAGLCAACVAVVLAMLRGPKASQRHGELVLRAPLSGLLPLTLAGGLLLLPQSLGSAGVLPLDALAEALPGRPQHLLSLGVSVVVLTVLCTWAFHRPRMIARLVPAMDAFAAREAVRAALPHTVVAMLALSVGAGLVERSLGAPLLVYVPSIAYLTALALDMRDEWRARERLGPLVPVWDEHRAYAHGPLQKALEDAGIPVHARAAHYRPLVQVMGPLVPLTLLVPPTHADAALAVLTNRNAAFQDQLAGHTPSTF